MNTNSIEKNSEEFQKRESIYNTICKMDYDKILLLYKFVEYIDSQHVIQHDNKNILNLLPFLLQLQNMKESQYGRSWCSHKDISAFFNLERKWDRISNIMSRVLERGTNVLDNPEDTGTPTETFIDTVVDCSVYALMWVGLMRELRPEQFEEFLKKNELI